MGLQGIIWDMDGVLVDTRELHFRTWVAALQHYQIEFSEQQFQETFGMNNRGLVITLLGRDPGADFVRAVSERKETRFREQVRGQARLLPGVRQWLETFRRSGLPMAVASSAPQANIDILVDALGIREYFSVLVSGAELPGKPDPAVFLQAARLIRVPPAACLVVEDAIPGVGAARAAGMKCIALTTTVGAERLGAADLVLDSLEQLSAQALGGLFGAK